MFGFGKADRRKDAVGGIASKLPGALEGLPPLERAAVLLIANCMLALAARIHGPSLGNDPRDAGAGSVESALDDLLPVRDRLAVLASDRESAHARVIACHLRATELTAITIGLGLDRTVGRAVARSWKAVWDGRSELREAVVMIRRYERVTGVEAVPRLAGGDIPSDVDLLRIGRRVPAFLRRRS